MPQQSDNGCLGYTWLKPLTKLGGALWLCTALSINPVIAEPAEGQTGNFTMDDLSALLDKNTFAHPAGIEAAEADGVEEVQGGGKAQPQASNWKTAEETDPLDDTKTVEIRTDAVSGQGAYGSSINLVIRCMSNELEAFVNWNTYLGSDDLSPNASVKRVTIRFGKNTPIVKTMGVSTNGQATFFRPKHLRRHIEIMALHDTFVAQVVPYGDNPVTAVFNTEGMGEALAPIQTACGW